MSSVSYAWAPITKSETQSDGTVTVYGPAASSALDRDGQRLESAWLDAAMPRWLAEGGGVREQHDPKRAVGVGVGLSKGDDGAHYLTAKIVDPIAVKKIQHGVLRGFSVGIKNPRIEMGKSEAPNGLVTAGEVVEISVCDRPANSQCTFELAKCDSSGSLVAVNDPQVVEKSDVLSALGIPTELYERLAHPVRSALDSLIASGAQVELAKVDAVDEAADEPLPLVVNVVVKTEEPDVAKDSGYNTAQRRKMAAAGQAMDDGSYPVKTKADLRKAIRAVGRGGADHNDIRKHIISRAKALGLSSMIPNNWSADGSLKKEASVGKADAATVEKAEAILADLRAMVPELTKADDGDESEDIDGATAAIAAIAQLIIAEAESLAEGNLNEAMDIELLLQAVSALKWFKCREESEAEMAESVKADAPDATKSAKKKPPVGGGGDDEEPNPDEEAEDGSGDKKETEVGPAAKKKPKAVTKSDETPQAEEDADLGKTDAPEAPEMLTKADVAEMVKAALAEAGTASEERYKALEADLAKAHGELEAIKAQPMPGGPVLTRTSAQESEARKADATQLRAQADELLAKADKYSSNPTLASGYRERANALLVKADA